MSRTRKNMKSNNDAVKRCRAKKKVEIEIAQKKDNDLSGLIESEMFEIHVLLEEYRCLRDRHRQAETRYISTMNQKFSNLESQLTDFHQKMERLAREKSELEEKYRTPNSSDKKVE